MFQAVGTDLSLDPTYNVIIMILLSLTHGLIHDVDCGEAVERMCCRLFSLNIRSKSRHLSVIC